MLEYSSTENFKLFDQITSASYFLCDLNQGEILKLSATVSTLIGHSVQQFLEKGIEFFLSLIHPEDYLWDCEEVKSKAKRNYEKLADKTMPSGGWPQSQIETFST